MGSRRSEGAPSDSLKHGKLILDCRKQRQGRSGVKMTIERVLDGGLPEAFTPGLFKAKSDSIFQYVDSYYGERRRVFTAMA